MTVTVGMAALNVPRTTPNDRFICVRVVNTGQGKTMVQNLALLYFESRPNKKLTKPALTYQAVVIGPAFGSTLPTSVEAGGEWSGFVRQTEEVERMTRSGYLYARVYHTMEQIKPISKRIIINDTALAPR